MPSALIAGPYSMHPLLGGTRHAQLPTGVLLRAALSHAVKVLDLKERLRYRRCGRKWRAVVSVKWWGQGQRAAPRTPRLGSIAVCPEKRQSSSGKNQAGGALRWPRNRKFVDSLLEEAGFEHSVPGG